MVFYLSQGRAGDSHRIPDGYHTQYKFPTCRGISWRAVNFVCVNGAWAFDGNESFHHDAWCHGSHDDNTYEVACGVR